MHTHVHAGHGVRQTRPEQPQTASQADSQIHITPPGPRIRDPLLQPHAFSHHRDARNPGVRRLAYCPQGRRTRASDLTPSSPAPWRRSLSPPVPATGEAGGGRLSGPGSSFQEGKHSFPVSTPRQPGNLPLLLQELAAREPICFQAISLFPTLLGSP